MRRKHAISLAITVFLVICAILYLWGPSSVPVGQAPLLTLSTANFSDFRKAFDTEADASRIILLLSPT
jgi:hypothetical protein